MAAVLWVSPITDRLPFVLVRNPGYPPPPPNPEAPDERTQ